MSAAEVLRFALRGLSANVMRSALTTLGITIGVGAVILLVAVGNGSGRQIQAAIESLGTNTLTVLGGLAPADAAALEDPQLAPDVRSASPVQSTQATATYGADSTDVTVLGSEPSYFTASNSPVATGAAFDEADVAAARRVLVIGRTVAEELFGPVDPVGQRVTVGGVPLTVVGVLAEKGSVGFEDADSTVIAPITTVRQQLTGFGSVSSILVQAAAADRLDAAQGQVSAILNARHDVGPGDEPGHQILNQSTLLETSNQTTETFTVLLGAVAAISLLVGGIGVTNIMLVTVTERTREIGVRKAIGAPRGAVLAQFLVEATLLSLAGGALGVLVGVVGSRFRVAGVQPVLVPASVVLAVGVSVAIGLFFGSYPAARAAALRPIEALRHE